MPLSEYERQREENIARNKALLATLGLEKPFGELIEKRSAKTKVNDNTNNKKRKSAAPDNEGSGGGGKPTKQPRKSLVSVTAESGDSPGPRRSQRNAGKKVDYASENFHRDSPSAAVSAGIRTIENDGPVGREAGSKRIHDPKTFGSIPGIAVGTWWETREGCSADAIHAPWVAGISGSKQLGAYSVALSGGYEDDIDLGSTFTYTGSGGRDLKGTKNNPKNLRTAPQTKDQTFEDNNNAALKKSCQTKKPIRVIRGYKLKSPYAPAEGYRYDGLYRIEQAWMDKGLEGFLVCKFAFKRLDGQPSLPCHNLDKKAAGNVVRKSFKKEGKTRDRKNKDEDDEDNEDGEDEASTTDEDTSAENEVKMEEDGSAEEGDEAENDDASSEENEN